VQVLAGVLTFSGIQFLMGFMTDPNIQLLTSLITSMIEAKLSGCMTYQGHLREFSPYLLGVTKDGRLVLHAFQYGGASSKGPITPQNGAWRFFYLDEIEDPITPGGDWYPKDFQKSEGDYRPPAFIATILAVTP
jgi:hypothetical protein